MIFDKLKALLANYAGTEVTAPIALGVRGNVVNEQCFFNCDCDCECTSDDCYDDCDGDYGPICSDDSD